MTWKQEQNLSALANLIVTNCFFPPILLLPFRRQKYLTKINLEK